MAKIQFVVRDNSKQTIAQAQLTMRCKLENEKEWISGTLKASNAGVIWLEIPDKTFKQINRRTVRLQVMSGGETLSHKRSKISDVGDGTFRVEVTVQSEQPESRESTTDTEPFKVTGKVVNGVGEPVGSIFVLAFDRDICAEKILGSAKTGKTGTYSIEYLPGDLFHPKKGSANLIVRAFESEDAETEPLSSSPLILNSGPHERVDLTTEPAYRGPSLFDYTKKNLDSQVAKHFDCIEIADIWLLSDRTQLSPNLIAQYVTAHRLYDDLEISGYKARTTALLFALLRSGVKDLVSLSNLRDDDIKRMLARAQRLRWIPEANYNGLLAKLRQARNAIGVDKDPSINTLFEIAKVPASKKAGILDNFRKTRHDKEALKKELIEKQGLSNAAADRLVNVIDAYQFFGANTLLLQQAKSLKPFDALSEVVAFEADDWHRVARGAADQVTLTQPGRDLAEKVRILAEDLNSTVQRRFPSAHFIHRILADEDLNAQAGSFFKKNPAFEFETQSIRNVFGDAANKRQQSQLQVLQGIESIYHSLPTLNRFQIFRTLWSRGVSHISNVASLGRQGLRAVLADTPNGIQKADRIVDASSHSAAKDVMLETNLIILQSASQVAAAQPTAAGPAGSAPFPTIQNLFGEVTDPDCDHCMSATSPAAYLVDLLAFVQRATDSAGHTGLDYLRGFDALEDARRPDIEQLELSCDNSDTPLPYIDLVLEVFENAVLKLALQPYTYHNTSNSAEELAAKPEHTNPSAYHALNKLVHPWVLPFNLAIATSRPYLKQLGLPRYRLLESLNMPETEPFAMAAASIDYLNLSLEQALIVAIPAAEISNVPLFNGHPILDNLGEETALKAYWGLTPSDPLTTLNDLKTFLQKTDLEQEVFNSILATEFVNPGGSVKITPGGELDGAGNDFFDRFHRFARLYLYTGRSIADLDTVLASLSADQLHYEKILNNLSIGFRFADEAGVSVQETVSCWESGMTDASVQFADILSENVEDIQLLSEMMTCYPDEPVELWKLWKGLVQFRDTGIEIDTVAGILGEPMEGDTYSTLSSQAILEELQNAIAIANEVNAPETGPETVPNNSLEANLALISGVIAESCDISQELVQDVLGTLETAPQGLRPAIFNQITDHSFVDRVIEGDTAIQSDFSRFWKQLALWELLDLQGREIAPVVLLSPLFGWLNPGAFDHANPASIPTLTEFWLLQRSQLFNQKYFLPDTSYFVFIAEFLQDHISNGAVTQLTVAAFMDELEPFLQWSATDLDLMLGSDGFNFSTWPRFLGGHALLQMDEAIELAELNDIAQVDLWGLRTSVDYAFMESLLIGKYGEEKWLDIASQIHDPLREQQRDALLGFLKKVVGAVFRTDLSSNDVYAYYLVDPEISSCFDTSRLKQAIASVQLLVQRIMLGLQSGVSFSDTADIEQWEWRKNYRVWEANRKVFIFPENWLEPEWRDNKTQLFEELEARLLQDEVREDTAREALLEYCRKLDKIGNLEISAIYEEPALEDTDAGRELHIFGRTRSIPHHYYHCLRNVNGAWSSWRKLELDIEGDHLLPVKYNGRMFLFWTSFQPATTEFNRDYTNILLNWSEQREDKVWGPKSVSEGSISDLNIASGNGEEYYMTVYESAGKLIVMVYSDAYMHGPVDLIGLVEHRFELGFFELDVCHNQVIANNLGNTSSQVVPNQSGDMFFYNPDKFRKNQKIVSQDGLVYVDQYKDLDPVLEHHYDDNRVTLPSNVLATEKLKAFCYEGNGRSFVVDRSFSTRVDIHPPRQPDPDPGPGPDDPPGGDPGPSPWPPGGWIPIDPYIPEIPEWIDGWDELNGDDRYDNMFHQENQWETDSSVFRGTGPGGQVFSNHGDLSINRSMQRSMRQSSPAMTVSYASQAGTLEASQGEMANWEGGYITASVMMKSDDRFKFTTFYHPFTCAMVRQLFNRGLKGLYAPDHLMPGDSDDLFRQRGVNTLFTSSQFDPVEDAVEKPYPIEQFEFTNGAPYSVYNWEVFFHAPMLIAKHLMRNQQFSDAQKWLHFIFNPTANDLAGATRFWRFRPFFLEQQQINAGDYTSVEQLAASDTAEFDAQVAEWEKNPFNPHAIARLRTVAYMRTTVMTYLDNLIAWGDQLFRRDTMESIGEAVQLYIYAAELLGPRPITLPAATSEVDSKTALELLRETEGSSFYLPGGSSTAPSAPEGIGNFLGAILNFCLPANDELLAYWDTVADRLFKVRHCMNIDGIVRSLALYEPPIDPGLLVKATAAGLSLDTVLGAMSAARPHYRFTYMLQKTNEFLSEVKALGGVLLGALEKRDAEELSGIRASHQLAMAKKILEVKKEQLNESEINVESASEALNKAMVTMDYYGDLSSRGDLDEEIEERKMLRRSHQTQQIAGVVEAVAATVSVIPNTIASVPPAVDFGGIHLSNAVGAGARGAGVLASQWTYEAGMLSREADKIRRNESWEHELKTSELEVSNLEKQLLAAEIRMAVADYEVKNQSAAIEHAEQEDVFLRDKFSNQDLYNWMVSELSQLYFAAFQLAEELARGAEKAYQYELGLEETADNAFIEAGHWDSLNKGLLSGEKLSLDLRRMELSYINKNKRQYELSKSVSLLQINPSSLLQLRETGNCVVTLPEALFDLDYAGHYKRRIKSVSLTIPAITGPYTNLACKLTLQSAAIRKEDRTDYVLETENVLNSIVTSSAQDDTGVFQLDFRDERYLPFEGAGVISTWELSLGDTELAQFNFSTISDVILRIDYTAKQGSETFANEVTAALKTSLGWATGAEPIPLIISLKAMFPDQWSRLLGSTAAQQEFSIEFNNQYLPYLLRNHTLQLNSCELVIDADEMPLTNWSCALHSDDDLENSAPIAELGAILEGTDASKGDYEAEFLLIPAQEETDSDIDTFRLLNLDFDSYKLVFDGDVVSRTDEIRDIYLVGMVSR